jgi:phospholipase/carboxylesterase
MNKTLIILLHGVGSRGEDLQGLGHFWRQNLPEVMVATPDGPDAFDMGPGYQWFSVNGSSVARGTYRRARRLQPHP